MSTEAAGTRPSFAKPFVLGLCVGVVVGAFAGVFLTPFLDGGSRIPAPPAGGATKPRTDPRETTPPADLAPPVDADAAASPPPSNGKPNE